MNSVAFQLLDLVMARVAVAIPELPVLRAAPWKLAPDELPAVFVQKIGSGNQIRSGKQTVREFHFRVSPILVGDGRDAETDALAVRIHAALMGDPLARGIVIEDAADRVDDALDGVSICPLTFVLTYRTPFNDLSVAT